MDQEKELLLQESLSKEVQLPFNSSADFNCGEDVENPGKPDQERSHKDNDSEHHTSENKRQTVYFLASDKISRRNSSNSNIQLSSVKKDICQDQEYKIGFTLPDLDSTKKESLCLTISISKEKLVDSKLESQKTDTLTDEENITKSIDNFTDQKSDETLIQKNQTCSCNANNHSKRKSKSLWKLLRNNRKRILKVKDESDEIQILKRKIEALERDVEYLKKILEKDKQWKPHQLTLYQDKMNKLSLKLSEIVSSDESNKFFRYFSKHPNPEIFLDNLKHSTSQDHFIKIFKELEKLGKDFFNPTIISNYFKQSRLMTYHETVEDFLD